MLKLIILASTMTEETNGDSSDASSSLDHALLESLFYNEMLLMDDPADEELLPAPDLSLPPVMAVPLTTTAATNPLANTTTTLPTNPPSNNNMNGSYVPPVMNGAAHTVLPPPLAPNRPALVPPPQQQWAAAPNQSTGMAVPQYPSNFSMPSATVTSTMSLMQQQQQPSEVSQERATLLVQQFATLASRLGISLPPNVLSSLTVAAAANESAQGALPPAVATCAPDATVSHEPPQVTKAIEDTAQAAIAAVNESHNKRRKEGAQPLYSKRRKKPRLSDCEDKLAALKAENEMLKRHVRNVTKKAQAFDQERQRATEEMKRMLQQGAPPEMINPVIAKFSEMYSDYGRHRHEELTFHLDQLEKLVAPTTFTKMGLWTLGQNEGFYTDPKRNPIAGILRKELGIKPEQGRKILEQRQKIRDVCDNLKQCLVLLGKLKGICEHKQRIFHDRMSKCQEILTPIQVVKLLLWVDDHSHLLESVCPGWGSERIRPKEPPTKPKAT